MLPLIISTQYVVGRSGLTLLARIAGANGNLATAGSFSAIAWNVRDLSNNYNVAQGTFTPASAMFDVPQLGPAGFWTRDKIGYNFLGVIPASALTAIGPIMQADVKFTPGDGSQQFQVPFKFKLQPTYA
jgi:hypothetical protein